MKNALITGASRGLGRGAARAFAARGYDLILTCSASGEALDAVCKELRAEYSVRILTSVGDVADEAYVAELFSLIEKEFGGLCVLVNNAGVDWVGLIQDMPLSSWERLLAVNLTGPFLTCRAAVPMMRRRGSGSIVNVSSVYGASGAACEAAYAATKGGINALTRSLAKELMPSGIRVNAVCPGAIDTAMNDGLSAEDRAYLIGEIPAGRFGTPAEAGELICDIAVSHPYLTGQLVTLDGGWV